MNGSASGRPLRVLVGCEFSGAVRRAFAARGHIVMSADLLPAEDGPGRHHYQGNVFDMITPGMAWDVGIFFPPCTDLAVSGARWFKDKQATQPAAIEFFLACAGAHIPRVAVENPVGIMSSRYRKPDQIIQPWQFGHGETKATCLWLRGLPKLTPTHAERPDLFASAAPKERVGRVWREPPGPDRWKARSRTYQGIADAMADQWGGNALAVAA